MPCTSYRPKQSDLVLTGAAESNFYRRSFLLRAVDSQVKILRTARMVSLDWRREVLAPGALACQRRLLGKSLGSRARVVSFSRIPFPRVATYVAQFRGVVELPAGTGKTIRLIVDSVLVSRGRSELSLVASAPMAERRQLTARERRLVRLMLRRARA
jgi:Rad3-related DNA helicase